MDAAPIIIEGDEQCQLDEALPDGGLSPLPGVQSYQVFRASHDVPELTDGRGWTYHHHVDMGCWRGRLYVGWNSCERDEDVWPSRELFSTSVDGRTWTDPQELFPQGLSTPLRMYFFYSAEAGRMLAIAGLRTDTADTAEDRKGPLVVREIRPDHTLGEVFTLQAPATVERRPPMFDESRDDAFVRACRQLLADRVYLEQQDRGKLLGSRRMIWHDAAAWPAGSVPGDSEKWVAGKAYSFFRRPVGELVGISKMGWTTTSRDRGETWTQPLVPPTLVTGKAKVWAQRMGDGRYALVYNPSRKNRYPLVIVTSDDGVHFRDMRLVQDELPVQRYTGLHRSIGPQYVRGISPWSDDGSRAGEGAMWLVYSMNKEDIWVSRVPVPAGSMDADAYTWNIYSPKWAPVTISGDELRLEDRDPYDNPSATRTFRMVRDATIRFQVLAEQPSGTLEVETCGEAPLSCTRLTVSAVTAAQWQACEFQAPSVQSITFRTGPRNLGGTKPAPPGSDKPTAPIGFRIRELRISAGVDRQ
ncbi:MAG TPA: exo-alpha-sialidase [Tepidisphaeraceae bacterium]|nr:exo-alpha-sialidase [Tepidisphaeraceae bacterium]